MPFRETLREWRVIMRPNNTSPHITAMFSINRANLLEHTRNDKSLFGLLIVCLLIFHGCATFNPRPIEEVPFRQRAQTQHENNVRVTVAVLSAEETKELFDLDLYKNCGKKAGWLTKPSTANIFSRWEVTICWMTLK